MESITWPINISKCLLALGPESDGNFSLFYKGTIFRSNSFGDLLNEENFQEFTRSVTTFLKNNRISPDVVLTDLHPLYRTTIMGEIFSKKYKARHVKIQHHIAHVFSAIGDKLIGNKGYKLKNTSYGIACDGTGYGSDELIWGGEILKIKGTKNKVRIVERVGHLENQTLIGGDLAAKEPVRMLISILNKFLPKEKIYQHVRKHYFRNEFEALYSQMRQNFNCQESSSAGRVLDAVSILLGFSDNVRKYKHGPAIELENNSTQPYAIKPKIIYYKNENQYVLQTTPLFEYLFENTGKDKKRLAATAQFYIAEGLYKIILRVNEAKKPKAIFFAGGITNNKIISTYFERKGIYASKKIPRGDAGISFGQIVHCLLANSRH